jgi:hypothetical protein
VRPDTSWTPIAGIPQRWICPLMQQSALNPSARLSMPVARLVTSSSQPHKVLRTYRRRTAERWAVAPPLHVCSLPLGRTARRATVDVIAALRQVLGGICPSASGGHTESVLMIPTIHVSHRKKGTH